jgi:hypothetical protein
LVLAQPVLEDFDRWEAGKAVIDAGLRLVAVGKLEGEIAITLF